MSQDKMREKKQSTIVERSQHTYKVKIGGTLDGFNTAHYLDTYGGFMREEVKFEPNIYIKIENIGDTNVVNPKIVINGRRNWYSIDDILSEITTESMSDEEKALAIFRFISSISVQAHDNDLRAGPGYPDECSNPSRNQFKERANPVKGVNCYYCGGCSLEAANFVILCRHAGLEARAIWMADNYTTHCVAEVKYNGEYHLFDPDERVFFLDSDNTNIASYEKVHKTPDIKVRTHWNGFAQIGERSDITPKEVYCKVYPPLSMPVEDWVSTMGIVLRPGESFIRRWDNIGKFGRAFNSRNDGRTPPYRLANGKLIYQPNLTKNSYRGGMVLERNIKSFKDDRAKPNLHMGVAGKVSIIMCKVTSPYPIVGGRVGGTFYRKDESDSIKIYFSAGDQEWCEIWSVKELGEPKRLGTFESYVDISYKSVSCFRGLDNKFDEKLIDPLNTAPKYEYYIKYEFKSDSSPTSVGIERIYLETDLQMASTSLPSLSVGTNKVVYTDKTRWPHRVKITHAWRESSESMPPKSPCDPIFPKDGQHVPLGSLKVLRWNPSVDPDGRGIQDYHIEVSFFPNFLIPVSPNFDRITRDDEPTWEIPEGWLVKGRTYYWRVKSRNHWGAWSNWSETWSFTVK